MNQVDPANSVKNVQIKRIEINDKCIRGELRIGNIDHNPIYTLENPMRKTTKDSAIPAGKYKCSSFSGLKYKNVYEIKDVPGRTAILIHNGNTEADTLGCILIGLELGELNGEPAVLKSKNAMEYFKSLIGKEDFNLEIID